MPSVKVMVITAVIALIAVAIAHRYFGFYRNFMGSASTGDLGQTGKVAVVPASENYVF